MNDATEWFSGKRKNVVFSDKLHVIIFYLTDLKH